MGYAKYYPGLCAELMAFLSGVQVSAIHKYLQEREIDSRFDERLYRYRNIQKFLQTHTVSNADAVKALTEEYGRGYSINTFKELKSSVPVPGKGLIHSILDPSSSRITSTSVFSDDWEILRAIQRLYLNNAPQFDCDLTFGRGDFYASGVATPIMCYDKFPLKSNIIDAPETLPLEETENIANESLNSIVIDLPHSISLDNSGDAFNSLEDLAQSYYNLFSIASRKLIPHYPGEQPGVLIVKVRDIDYEGKRLWMAKIVTDLATGKESTISRPVYEKLTNQQREERFEFELVDKYIHTFRPESISTRRPSKSVISHETFLIFQKRGNEYDIMYDSGITGIIPAYHATNHNNYTPYFTYGTLLKNDCKNQHSKNLHAVKVAKKIEGNHIDAYAEVPENVLKKISGALSMRLPQVIIGSELIKFLNRHYEMAIISRNSHFRKRSYTEQQEFILKHISTTLFKAGILFFDFGREGRVYFKDFQ